jgi:sortase A
MNRVDPPPVIDEPGIRTTFATLYVPRWGQGYVKPISQGVTRRDVLDRLGIGHYPRTAMPGDLGNFAIAGHRTTFGKPFSRIEKLKEGNAIVVRTEHTWYVYRVTSTLVVDPHQVGVIAANPLSPGAEPTARMITLTTCHPRYSARLRYIVHGELDYWAPADAGYPPEIARMEVEA